MRQLIILAIVAIMLALAAHQASGQVKCTCSRVMLPIIHNAPVDVDAATRFWGG